MTHRLHNLQEGEEASQNERLVDEIFNLNLRYLHCKTAIHLSQQLTMLVALIYMLGCATQSNSDSSSSQVTPVQYYCENDLRLSVQFSAEQAMLTILPSEQTSQLHRQISASGFFYGDDNLSIRGKGTELTLVQKELTAVCRSVIKRK